MSKLMTVGEYAKSKLFKDKVVTAEHIRNLLLKNHPLPSVKEVQKTVDGKFILVVED
jgi:hypothetical protein